MTRSLPRTTAVIAVSALASATAAAGVDAVLEECRDRVMDYAYYWDHGDAEGLAGIFTADASLTLGGDTFNGPAAIAGRMARSEPELEIRHLMSTVRITGTEDGGAAGVSYVTVYTAPKPADGMAEVDGITMIGEYHDRFRITADGCRIAERTLVSVFRQRRMP